MDTELGQTFGKFIQEVLVIIIMAFLPIILNEARKAILAFAAKVRGQAKAEDIALIEAMARIFVTGAEQSGLTDILLKEGAAKKAEVLKKLQEFADQKKINISVDVLDSIIESVVWQTLGFDKRIAATTQKAKETPTDRPA